MQRATLVLLVAHVLAPGVPAWAGGWGRVFAVEVRGNGLAVPLVITDSAVVQDLSFWVGPGTGFSEFMGPVSLERSIIAWHRGEATDRPNGLEIYEVRFLLEPQDDPPAYIVWYQPDAANDSGYIYIPASSGHIVWHGVADTWMYASSRWNERVGGAISERLSAQPQGKLGRKRTSTRHCDTPSTPYNVRDQRRRAVGAPLADRSLSSPGPVPASGVPTSADRCIA